jgi:hypothetical protein
MAKRLPPGTQMRLNNYHWPPIHTPYRPAAPYVPDRGGHAPAVSLAAPFRRTRPSFRW